MRILRSILQFLVFSNVYVAIPVTALALSTHFEFLQPINFVLLGYVYCATLLLYGLHRLLSIERIPEADQSPRHRWASRHKPLLFGVTLAAGLAAALLFSYLTISESSLKLALALIPAALLALGYSVPWIPVGGKRLRLRDIPYIKVVLIAAVVTWVTLIIPLLMRNSWSDLMAFEHLGWMAVERMCFLIAITIPFDIRDVEADRSEGVQTIPVAFGTTVSIGAAAVFTLGSGIVRLTIISHISDWNSHAQWIWLPELLSMGYTLWVIAMSGSQRSEFFYSLAVEGTMIVRAAATYAAIAIWLQASGLGL